MSRCWGIAGWPWWARSGRRCIAARGAGAGAARDRDPLHRPAARARDGRPADEPAVRASHARTAARERSNRVCTSSAIAHWVRTAAARAGLPFPTLRSRFCGSSGWTISGMQWIACTRGPATPCRSWPTEPEHKSAVPRSRRQDASASARSSSNADCHQPLRMLTATSRRPRRCDTASNSRPPCPRFPGIEFP